MTKNEKKSKVTDVANLTEIDEQESDELLEKRFKKLMRETKTERYKSGMKYYAEKLNPDNFPSIRDFAKTIRQKIICFYIEICELEKERDEAQQKLREYENKSLGDFHGNKK